VLAAAVNRIYEVGPLLAEHRFRLDLAQLQVATNPLGPLDATLDRRPYIVGVRKPTLGDVLRVVLDPL